MHQNGCTFLRVSGWVEQEGAGQKRRVKGGGCTSTAKATPVGATAAVGALIVAAAASVASAAVVLG
jgi:hypothetical protein